MSLFNELHIDHINSATKYPSIPTYHVLKGRGNLTEQRSCTFDSDCIATEKVDGCNGRIVFAAGTGDYIIGSREELLHARGDRIANPSMRIVEALRPVADRMVEISRTDDVVLVLWGEVFGGKQYRCDDAVDFRLFDAAMFSVSQFQDVCSRERASIASWRDAGNQPFGSESMLHKLAHAIGVELTPRLTGLDSPPSDIEGTHEWLKRALPHGSLVNHGGKGTSEGIVVRSVDRKRIAKIRFEDYERAAR